jgi:hypothetical protein
LSSFKYDMQQKLNSTAYVTAREQYNVEVIFLTVLKRYAVEEHRAVIIVSIKVQYRVLNAISEDKRPLLESSTL